MPATQRAWPGVALPLLCARQIGTGFLTIEGGMAGFEDVHVTAALAAELERLGWSAGEPRARELAAAAARGTNLIVESPPAAWHGLPVLAGLLSITSSRPRRLLVLVSAASLDEWAEATAPLSFRSSLRP